jgi:hypothetical protein
MKKKLIKIYNELNSIFLRIEKEFRYESKRKKNRKRLINIILTLKRIINDMEGD